jgi:hypothetical protein
VLRGQAQPAHGRIPDEQGAVLEGMSLAQVVDRGLGARDLGGAQPELRLSWTFGVALAESALIRR